MKKIALIGTGIMGSAIAMNFLKHGFEVFVWNRSNGKLKKLIEQGAIPTNSPKEAAEKADIVFEVTASDESSRSVWTGDNGILAGANSNKILITNATLSIDWTDELARLCRKQKLQFFDMPMTGGRVGAEAGKLVLLVGGDEKKLKLLEKDLKAIAERIIYFGKIGSGMRYKLLLNMLQAIHIVGFGEVMRLAKETGLDLKKVGDALAERPGGTTTNLSWRDYQKDPKPINFSVEWIAKDLKYAKKNARKTETPLLNEALKQYKKVIAAGKSQKDWTFVNKMK